jgi:hypothetical protein
LPVVTSSAPLVSAARSSAAASGGQSVPHRGVGRPRAAVDHGDAFGETAQRIRVGGVRGDALDGRVLRSSAVSGDQPDPLATVRQQLRGSGADRSGADHQLHIHTRSSVCE